MNDKSSMIFRSAYPGSERRWRAKGYSARERRVALWKMLGALAVIAAMILMVINGR